MGGLALAGLLTKGGFVQSAVVRGLVMMDGYVLAVLVISVGFVVSVVVRGVTRS